MPNPFARHSKARRDRRRNSHFMVSPIFSLCESCGRPVLPHRVCGNCGYYRSGRVREKKRGRRVIDYMKKQFLG